MEKPIPPESIPEEIQNKMKEQEVETLRDIIDYSRMLIEWQQE